MRWRHVPGDSASDAEDGDQDRIVIDRMEGEEGSLALLGDIAAFYADQNVRAGYDVEIRGDCCKGPQGINWSRIAVVFEHDPAVARLRAHLEEAWGPQGEDISHRRSSPDIADSLARL